MRGLSSAIWSGIDLHWPAFLNDLRSEAAQMGMDARGATEDPAGGGKGDIPLFRLPHHWPPQGGIRKRGMSPFPCPDPPQQQEAGEKCGPYPRIPCPLGRRSTGTRVARGGGHPCFPHQLRTHARSRSRKTGKPPLMRMLHLADNKRDTIPPRLHPFSWATY
jgi:hypothetical protein